MEKKKVLFVVHHLTIGGAQKSMISALKAIDYNKNDVTLYVRKKRLDLLSEIDEHVKVIVNDDKTHYYRKPYALIYLAIIFIFKLFRNTDKADVFNNKLSEKIREDMMKCEVRNYFRGKHFDVAIAYIQGYTSDIVAYGIDAEKKYLFYHSSTDEAHELHCKSFAEFDKIVAVGDNVKNILQKLYPQFSERIDVLYNFVNADEIIEKSRKENLTIKKGKTILCSCGRLSSVKGFDLAVKAAKILKDNGYSFKWYFVGDGPQRKEIESLIEEYKLSDFVEITGMKDNPYPWIDACDIYVQPSYEESYGLTIAEAMILCKPVVTTATVGGKYLIKDCETGILTQINAEDLARGIEELLKDEKLKRNIIINLEKIDCKEELEKYKNGWSRLLEG